MTLIKALTQLEEAVMIKSTFDESCIVHQSLNIIGDKWSILVLMSLIKGSQRTHQIQKEVVGISSKMLSQTLRKLEFYQIISKEVFPVVPPKVEYSLTGFGTSLIEPMDSLFRWSIENEALIRKLDSKGKQM